MDIYIKDDNTVDVLNISEHEAIVLLKSLKGRYMTIQKMIEVDEGQRKEVAQMASKVWDVKPTDKNVYSTESLSALFAAEYSLLYDVLHKSGVKL